MNSLYVMDSRALLELLSLYSAVLRYMSMFDFTLRSACWWYSDPFRVALDASYLLTTSLAAEKY